MAQDRGVEPPDVNLYVGFQDRLPHRRHILHILELIVGIEPTTTVLQTATKPLGLISIYVVGKEGLEPSMFLMSRIYSPLVSPLSALAHKNGGNRKIRTSDDPRIRRAF